MFKRRRLRKLAGKSIEPTILLYVYPTVEIEEKVTSILGKDKADKLLAMSFGKIAQDPIILKALKKVLQVRTRKLVDNLIDILEELGQEGCLEDKNEKV